MNNKISCPKCEGKGYIEDPSQNYKYTLQTTTTPFYQKCDHSVTIPDFSTSQVAEKCLKCGTIISKF